MSLTTKLGLVFLVVTVSGGLCFADTFVDRNSSGPHTGGSLLTAFLTIQEGIDAAASGDTVWVNDGVYFGPGNVELDFQGKAVTVASIKGAHLTVIDLQDGPPAVVFSSGEGADSVFKGFTIFQAGDDGAIVVENAGPTISDNVIRNCTTLNGAVTVSNATPVITRNVIFNCTGEAAGGIWMNQCNTQEVEVSSNIIHHCGASNGGAMTIVESTVLLINNTFADNIAQNAGGAVRIEGSTVDAVNSIFWENNASAGDAASLDLNGGNASVLNIDFCDVQGGESSIQVDGSSTLNFGVNNIDANPLFLDPAAFDYHIPFDSPCRRAGTRSHSSLPEFDFEGDPIASLFVLPEIGADEFATHFYIRGQVSAGSTVELVFIGWPNTSPVVLLRGKWLARDPRPTPYGDLLLGGRLVTRRHFNPIPVNGVRVVEWTVNATPGLGFEAPFQVLIGTELSNLWVARFEP